MDYLSAKFGDCTFSHFGFIMQTNTQTDTHTDVANRHTHATTVGMSKVTN